MTEKPVCESCGDELLPTEIAKDEGICHICRWFGGKKPESWEKG